jgi:hypothetical protein
MTAGEMARYGESIGVRVTGSKADIMRQLEPIVKAAEGTEPFETDAPAVEHHEPETKPFEPTVFDKTDARKVRDAMRRDA